MGAAAAGVAGDRRAHRGRPRPSFPKGSLGDTGTLGGRSQGPNRRPRAAALVRGQPERPAWTPPGECAEVRPGPRGWGGEGAWHRHRSQACLPGRGDGRSAGGRQAGRPWGAGGRVPRKGSGRLRGERAGGCTGRCEPSPEPGGGSVGASLGEAAGDCGEGSCWLAWGEPQGGTGCEGGRAPHGPAGPRATHFL